MGAELKQVQDQQLAQKYEVWLNWTAVALHAYHFHLTAL